VFSKQLILKAVEFLLMVSHAEMNNKIVFYDLDGRGIDLKESLPNIRNAVGQYLISNPNVVDNHGDSILLRMMNNVVEKMLQNVAMGIDGFDEERKEFRSDRDFYRFLRLDGYDINFQNLCIVEDLALYLQVAEKNDEIIEMLKRYDFNTSLGHYNQAKSSYLGANYAALNGQLRTFVEAIFQDMAAYIRHCEPANADINIVNEINAQSAMIIFAKCNYPILNFNLNEWDGNNQTMSYFPAFWKRLHPQGCHPGLPEMNEAIYRFQLVVLNIELLVSRFQLAYPLRNF